MANSGILYGSDGYEGRIYYVKWTTTSQNVSTNQSTVQWTVGCSGGTSSWYAERTLNVVVNGTTVYSKSDWVQRYAGDIASGTVTIAHNTDGTKSFNISLQAAVYVSDINCTGSQTFTLDTIVRASIPTLSNVGAMGTTMTINTNRASSSFTHTLTYNFGGKTGTIGTNIGASCTWTIPKSFANVIPNATSGYGTITCVTYNGSTQIGSKNVTFTTTVPSTFIPTINSISIAPENSNSTISGWGSIYVQGYSKAKITATASGSYGSTIKSFKITGKDSASISGTSLSYSSNTLKTTSKAAYTVVAIDSRGRSSASKTVTVDSSDIIPYSAPSILSFSGGKDSANATQATISSEWKYSSVSGKNKITAVNLFYKKQSESSWTSRSILSLASSATADSTGLSKTQTISNASLTGLSESDGYNLKITITDSLGKSSTKTLLIMSKNVLMDFKAGGTGIAIGKEAEQDETFQVGKQTEFFNDISVTNASGALVPLRDMFYPVGSIKLTTVDTNPGTYIGGTWIAWGKGKVPVGVNSSDDDFSTVEQTGGSKNNTHNHWQTVSSDDVAIYATKTGVSPRSRTKKAARAQLSQTPTTATTREDSTYNETISILQPYITCYMWKRTK
jgi:hypothetical protein